jgi:hypothetical protein
MIQRSRERTGEVPTLALGPVVAAVLFAVAASTAVAQSSGTWALTGSLNTARAVHTATLLPNGQVLVAGGENTTGILASAELYNPSTGKWTETGSMSTPRINHQATLLANGQVLVSGGHSSTGALASAELFNPSTGQWTTTGSMTAPRTGHSALLLGNGQVLVVPVIIQVQIVLRNSTLLPQARGEQPPACRAPVLLRWFRSQMAVR